MWLIIAIVALTIVLDQVTKYLVASQMTIGQSIPIIDNFLYITSHRNAGAAWGIFQGKMMFFLPHHISSHRRCYCVDDSLRY